MKGLIIYDSQFGNTSRVARAMATQLGDHAEVTVSYVENASPDHLLSLDFLIVGSPTHAFRPTPAVKKFLARIPRHGLAGVSVAAFDTRISKDDVDSHVVAFLMKVFGYAAKPIADELVSKGGTLAMGPEGFIVAGKEGPLKEDELKRATEWAMQILEAHATVRQPVAQHLAYNS